MKAKSKRRLVLIGGGTGVSCMASHFKHLYEHITLIQTVADSGGHSGRLRREFGIIPLGDLTRGVIALSPRLNPILRRELEHRFHPQGNWSYGDTRGANDFLLRLHSMRGGDVQTALDDFCQLCHVRRGSVLPVSLDDTHLEAILSNGKILRGEHRIDTRRLDSRPYIVSARLRPEVDMQTAAYEAVIAADDLIFCPGDFWTSLIACILPFGFIDAIMKSRARKILIVNLMTKWVETRGYTSNTFARILCEYLQMPHIDVGLFNDAVISPDILSEHKERRYSPVKFYEGHHVLAWKKDAFVDDSGGHLLHNAETARQIRGLKVMHLFLDLDGVLWDPHGIRAPYTDVREIVPLLADSCVLSLVTAGDRDFQRSKLAACGIESYLDHVRVVRNSREKPSVFKSLMAQHPEIDRHHTVILGDTWGEIRPANLHKLISIRIKRPGGKYASAESDLPLDQPTHVVRSLTEIVPIVDGISRI